MNTLQTVVVVIQVLSALLIIGLVLIQHGKGADMGAAFGSGASGSLFGASGSSNFLSKSTGFAAVIFFSATLGLAFFGGRPATVTGGVMDNLPAPAATAPAAASQPTVPGQTAPTAPVAPAQQGTSVPPADQSSQIPK